MSSDLIDLSTSSLIFKKTKTNYVIYNSFNKKHQIKLNNVFIPFGMEKYGKLFILNIELNPTDNNTHYNYYSILSQFEEDLKNKQFNNQQLINDLNGKDYSCNLRNSKCGNIIRTHVSGFPKSSSIVNGIKCEYESRNIKKASRINVILELGTIWISDNSYGFSWNVKELEYL